MFRKKNSTNQFMIIQTLRGNLCVLFIPMVFFSAVLLLSSCQTKSEVRREQEMVKLRNEIKTVRGSRADAEVEVEELKGEIARLANVVEERAQFQTQQFEVVTKELQTINMRVQAVEQQLVAQQLRKPEPEQPENIPVTLQTGREYYVAGKYDEAVEVLKEVVKKMPAGKDKDARFLLAETYFTQKEYALSAIEFGEFKKKYPKDVFVPKAIFFQGQAFNKLNKKKEARLFFQELIDKYPKSSFARSAKKEMK